jgi:hypothetical protein
MSVEFTAEELADAQNRLDAMKEVRTAECIAAWHDPVLNLTRTGDETQTLACRCGQYIYRAEKRA